MVDGIVCTVNLKQDTIEAGEGGQSLYMYNPFMTQELLENIFSQYRGIRYTGAVLQARWDPSLVPGEFVRIMTDSEYKNYVAMNNAMANSSGKTAAEILNLKKKSMRWENPCWYPRRRLPSAGKRRWKFGLI